MTDIAWFVRGFVWASWQRARGRIDYRGSLLSFTRDVWRLVRAARMCGSSFVNVIPPEKT